MNDRFFGVDFETASFCLTCAASDRLPRNAGTLDFASPSATFLRPRPTMGRLLTKRDGRRVEERLSEADVTFASFFLPGWAGGDRDAAFAAPSDGEDGVTERVRLRGEVAGVGVTDLLPLLEHSLRAGDGIDERLLGEGDGFLLTGEGIRDRLLAGGDGDKKLLFLLGHTDNFTPSFSFSFWDGGLLCACLRSGVFSVHSWIRFSFVVVGHLLELTGESDSLLAGADCVLFSRGSNKLTRCTPLDAARCKPTPFPPGDPDCLPGDFLPPFFVLLPGDDSVFSCEFSQLSGGAYTRKLTFSSSPSVFPDSRACKATALIFTFRPDLVTVPSTFSDSSTVESSDSCGASAFSGAFFLPVAAGLIFLLT